MCGRYYVDDDTFQDIERVVDEIDASLRAKTGDVHPSEKAVIITGRTKEKEGLRGEAMHWGFPGMQKSQLLINARAESAQEKPLFRESLRYRRCIIPAKHFYEWDADRSKAEFRLQDESCLYMAGFYNYSGNEDRFVILTTEANDSMRSTHDRMPLILPEKQIRSWIFDDTRIDGILRQGSPMLVKQQDYEQLCLWNISNE